MIIVCAALSSPFGFSYLPNLGIRFYGSVIGALCIPVVCVYIYHSLHKNSKKSYLVLPTVQWNAFLVVKDIEWNKSSSVEV